MLPRQRRFVRFSFAWSCGVAFCLSSAALVLSCSTYGEDTANPPATTTSDGSSTSNDDASSSADGGSLGSIDGANTGDASSNDAKPAFNEKCPPCTNGATCLASGCVGDGILNACNTPFDVPNSTSLVVFLCPEGATTTLSTICTNNTGTSKHAAALRLGDKGDYTITATASGGKPIVAVGACDSVTACSGGLSSATRTVPKFSTVLISTATDVTSCLLVSVDIVAN